MTTKDALEKRFDEPISLPKLASWVRVPVQDLKELIQDRDLAYANLKRVQELCTEQLCELRKLRNELKVKLGTPDES